MGSWLYVFGWVEDDAVEEDERGEEGTHPIKGGDFAFFFHAGGVAIHRHPAAATGGRIVHVLAVGGEVPVNQAVEDEPPDEAKDALAEAHRNRYRGSYRAHPHEQIKNVLYHSCELAVRVPNNAMRIGHRLELRFYSP